MDRSDQLPALPISVYIEIIKEMSNKKLAEIWKNQKSRSKFIRKETLIINLINSAKKGTSD